jgi:hypothetical protein
MRDDRCRPSVTKSAARAFRERWQRLERAESVVLRRWSIDDRLRRLAALMASGSCATSLEAPESFDDLDRVLERARRRR